MLKRTHIINYIAETLNLTDYLEIGLGDGLNFSSIICANKCGVDPNPGHFTLEGATIIPLTSDEFFAKCKKTFDLIFLDGLHYADVLERDIKHALAALNPGGIIICHDVSPTSEDMQQVPRLRPEWTGDCWKAWLRVRREMPSMPMTVIDVDYGVGVIYPEGKAAYASVCIPPGDIGFESFATCKKEWLPTISADELPLFLGKANLPFPAYRQIKRATLNSAPRANRPFLVYCPTYCGSHLGEFFGEDRLFDVALNDYSGKGRGLDLAEWKFAKPGHKWPGIHANLQELPVNYEYYAFIDDDIIISTDALNTLFLVGYALQLQLYQAALSEDSICAHTVLKQRQHSYIRATGIVEIMMPIFSKTALDICVHTFARSESGWGLDLIWPDYLEHTGLAVVDVVVAEHLRPINSAQWQLANGNTAAGECEAILSWHSRRLLGIVEED